jgi:hypothetical protein
MKFNYDFTMVDLDNEPLLDQEGNTLHAGRTLAKMLMQVPDAGPDVMTKFDWAEQLHKTGIIDLDKAGVVAFKKAIEAIPNVWLIVRGILIRTLENRKEEVSNS